MKKLLIIALLLACVGCTVKETSDSAVIIAGTMNESDYKADELRIVNIDQGIMKAAFNLKADDLDYGVKLLVTDENNKTVHEHVVSKELAGENNTIKIDTFVDSKIFTFKSTINEDSKETQFDEPFSLLSASGIQSNGGGNIDLLQFYENNTTKIGGKADVIHFSIQHESTKYTVSIAII